MRESRQSQTKLVICETDGDLDNSDSMRFCIDDELTAISDETYDEIYSFLNNVSIETDISIPLYRMVNWQLLYPPRNEIALVYLLPLAKRLATAIEAHDIDTLVCTDLPEQYRPVIRDTANATETAIDASWSDDQSSVYSRQLIMFAFVTALGLFADQVVSLLLSPFLRPRKRPDTMFIPSAGRYDSTGPVVQATDSSNVVLVSILTVTWYWGCFRGRYDSLPTDVNFAPVNLYVTPRTMVCGMITYVQILIETVIKQSLPMKLESAIASKLSVPCHHTVHYAVGKLYTPYLLINILMTHSFSDAVERTECDNVVTSIGSGSAAQAIWYACEKADIDCYYLPHSITLVWRKRAPKPVEKFVPGSISVQDAEARSQLDTTENLIPLGRPYLAEIYNKRESFGSDDNTATGPIQILIATEPLDDTVRRAFVTRILDALEGASFECSICVKTHPDEDAEFYESLRTELGADFSIEDTSLHERLYESDLVATMASNVGLEAIILGTANVCITEWRPFVRPLPYAQLGPVPVLTSESDCTQFFTRLDRDRLKELADEQWMFVSENYELQPDTEQRIARYISENRR